MIEQMSVRTAFLKRFGGPMLLVLSLCVACATFANDVPRGNSASESGNFVSFAAIASEILNAGKQHSAMVIRQWSIQPSNMTTDQAAHSTATNPAVWKVFFEHEGVEWPEGSYVNYIPEPGVLVIQNTTNNLNLIGIVLKNLSEREP